MPSNCSFLCLRIIGCKICASSSLYTIETRGAVRVTPNSNSFHRGAQKQAAKGNSTIFGNELILEDVSVNETMLSCLKLNSKGDMMYRIPGGGYSTLV